MSSSVSRNSEIVMCKTLVQDSANPHFYKWLAGFIEITQDSNISQNILYHSCTLWLWNFRKLFLIHVVKKSFKSKPVTCAKWGLGLYYPHPFSCFYLFCSFSFSFFIVSCFYLFLLPSILFVLHFTLYFFFSE